MILLTEKVKQDRDKFHGKLAGKTLGLLFEKPSLRTKASFYVGGSQLGLVPVYFSPQEVKLGQRESTFDGARVLSRYMDCVVLRTFSHNTILDFVRAATIPVINGLSDLVHPTQILGDLFTLHELKQDIKKIKFTYMGDGNNICNSLLYAFSIMGGNLMVITPKQYSPDREAVKEAVSFSRVSGAKIEFSSSPEKAVCDSDVLYTDVWASMGQEDERQERVKKFRRFQVNDDILALAGKGCLVMHCLPAKRGEEITGPVLESGHSVVFLQAENRLHAAKAILLSLLSGEYGVNV